MRLERDMSAAEQSRATAGASWRPLRGQSSLSIWKSALCSDLTKLFPLRTLRYFKRSLFINLNLNLNSI